jgi:hypothetical protein
MFEYPHFPAQKTERHSVKANSNTAYLKAYSKKHAQHTQKSGKIILSQLEWFLKNIRGKFVSLMFENEFSCSEN